MTPASSSVLICRYASPALVLLAAVMLQVPAANAIPITFVANLTQALEVPPTASPGTGSATVILDPAANTMHAEVTFSGLTSGTTAAHIHCCLASPFLAGVNVGVATTVPAFPGFPLGVTSGTYSSPVFDLTQSTIYNTTPITGFVALQGGIPQAEAALIAGIENGETYFNIHTMMFPGGEERDFLAFLVPVPEPASLVLLGSAVVGFWLTGRRRKPTTPAGG
jgi:hypothetical protein